MGYLFVEDFRSGLDTRKSIFTAPPGSLRVLTNGHITRGGEIEKSRAFAPYADLSSLTASGVDSLGLHAVDGKLYVFGHRAQDDSATPIPDTVAGGLLHYQQLQHPTNSATPLTRILSVDNFDGKIYVVAEFNDGSIYHYYDGARVTAWDELSADVADLSAVAQNLADKIEGGTAFTTSVSGSVLTVTGVLGEAFTYSVSAFNGGSNPDQTLTANETQAALPAVSEVLATGSFKVTGGSAVPGTNQVSTVTVDGIEILGAAVDYNTSNSQTAADIAAQINGNVSSPDYDASADGDVVTITAKAGTGSSPNGLVVGITTDGDVTVGDVQNLSGGVDAQSAQAQIVEFTFGGTFETADRFFITLDGSVFKTTGGSVGTGDFVLTFDDKVYSVTPSLLHFSGFRGDPQVADPTAWGDGITGAGFINMATKDGGAENLAGLGVYQSQLAVFSNRAIQVWAVDPDPDLNGVVQTLPNLGTRSPHSIRAYGDQDLFFLSDSGVRSLRARDSSNLAAAQDVGTPIDADVVSYLRTLTDTTIRNAKSVVDPVTGRYWLALGNRVYVFTHFPGSSIAAWSIYEPGLSFTDFAVRERRIYARAGDMVYLYGGASGEEYDDSVCEVVLPFLDGEDPGTSKTLLGLDIGCEGSWDVFLAPDPQNPNYYEHLGTVEQATYGLQERFPAEGMGTHFGIRLLTTGSGRAALGNLAIHFTSGAEG